MIKKLLLTTLFFSYANASEWIDTNKEALKDKIVLSVKQIHLEEFPNAFNPSIIEFDNKFLLSFRYQADYKDPSLNYIGVVLLDRNLEEISKPQLLDTRVFNNRSKSQSEDARIFTYRGRIFLIYNDNVDENVDINDPIHYVRRDMFVAELLYSDDHFFVSPPIKLICEEKYSQYCQKNWVPFEWDKKLLITYTINPHEVLYTNLNNGTCYLCYNRWVPIKWNWGILRGSTPPIFIDGEFLAFFHSGKVLASPVSWGWELWHYFMGAYTFSAEPPFQLTKISPKPIIGKGCYTQSHYGKRIVFPGGCVISGSIIYLAYGKDDHEVWVATLDLLELKKSLVPIETE